MVVAQQLLADTNGLAVEPSAMFEIKLEGPALFSDQARSNSKNGLDHAKTPRKITIFLRFMANDGHPKLDFKQNPRNQSFTGWI